MVCERYIWWFCSFIAVFENCTLRGSVKHSSSICPCLPLKSFSRDLRDGLKTDSKVLSKDSIITASLCQCPEPQKSLIANKRKRLLWYLNRPTFDYPLKCTQRTSKRVDMVIVFESLKHYFGYNLHKIVKIWERRGKFQLKIFNFLDCN